MKTNQTNQKTHGANALSTSKKGSGFSKKTKLGAIALAMLLMGGCGQKEDTGSSQSFKIGITQIADHKALNDARDGFEERVQELGMDAEFIHQNAQGDISNALLIANGFVADQTDLILGIATPAVQAAQNATKENKIPVVFIAVSAPVEAGIVESMDNGSGNITGVTDAVTKENTADLLELFKVIKPEAKSIGVIFNTGEANSIAQIKILKEAAQTVGLEVVEVGINEITSIDPALETISSKADALFLINDNMVASSVGLISEKAKQKQLITLSADSSHVESGAMLSLGISYKALGIQAADLAKRILVDLEDPGQIPVESSNNLELFVNEDTGKSLGINLDIPELADAILVGASGK